MSFIKSKIIIKLGLCFTFIKLKYNKLNRIVCRKLRFDLVLIIDSFLKFFICFKVCEKLVNKPFAYFLIIYSFLSVQIFSNACVKWKLVDIYIT